MANSNPHSHLIPLKFFIDIARACHTRFRGKTHSFPGRIVETFDDPAIKLQLDRILGILQDREVLKTLLAWMVHELSPFTDELAIALQQHPQSFRLHYRHHSEPDSAWHNTNVRDARDELRREMLDHLKVAFPHWDEEELRKELESVPPLLLLEEELSEECREIRSLLTIDFAVNFVASSYIVHLGSKQFSGLSGPEVSAMIKQDGQKGHSILLNALEERHPRFIRTSHAQLFREVAECAPFKASFQATKRSIREMRSTEKDLDEAIICILYLLSLPYAHSFLTSTGFIEAMDADGAMAVEYNKFRLMGWMCSSGFYLRSFANPNGEDVKDMELVVPLAAEIFNYTLSHTFAGKLHSPLATGTAAQDSEFDD